jgi:hypothetical protein
MSTSLSQYKTALTAAQSAYLAALQTLYGAMVDLEALTVTVERCGGGPQAHFSATAMGEWQDLFAFLEHPTAAPRGSHFGGALVATAATTTASAVLTVKAVPSWVVAGLVVLDSTSGTSVGTVLSTTSTTITLAANAANAVAAADVLIFSFGPSGRIRDRISTAANAYIAAWSGS